MRVRVILGHTRLHFFSTLNNLQKDKVEYKHSSCFVPGVWKLLVKIESFVMSDITARKSDS